MKKENTDNLVKQAAEEYPLPEGRDRQANWQRLASRLDEDKKRRGAIWYLRIAAGVALAITMGASLVWFIETDEKDSKSIAMTEVETLAVPDLYAPPPPSSYNSPNNNNGIPSIHPNNSKTIEFQVPTPKEGKETIFEQNGTTSKIFLFDATETSTDLTSGLAQFSAENLKSGEFHSTYGYDYNLSANAPAYSYQWTPNIQLQEQQNLATGTYSVTNGFFQNGSGIVSPAGNANLTLGVAQDQNEITTGVPFLSIADTIIQRNVEQTPTEDYDRIVENIFLPAMDNPQSTFSIDVDAAAYSNMRRFITSGQLPPRNSVRTEEFVNYFSYEYATPRKNEPFSINTEIGECPWDREHKLLHIGLQGLQIDKENLPPSNLIFLIDVSGSMSEYNKLPLLKKAFKMLVEQLRPEDHVGIVVYAGAAGTVLEPTPGNQKEKILASLMNLEAGGSTAGAAGIEQAYRLAKQHFRKDGNNRVILATDGDFNVGQSSDADLVTMIEKKREDGIFLSVLGFGMGNYKDKKMQDLADHGNGNHSYIDTEKEAKKIFVEEFGGTLFAIAKDVKIQLEFNPALVASYRLIGYENRLLRNEDFENDAIDAGELGVGHTVTALYEIVPAKGNKNRKSDLKYQSMNLTDAAKSGEIVTVKLRYKAPDGDKSKLLSHTVMDASTRWDKTSRNFRWSAAVAEYALLLLQSEYKGNSSYGQVLDLAQTAIGPDPNGYRKEFVELVKRAKGIFEGAAVRE